MSKIAGTRQLARCVKSTSLRVAWLTVGWCMLIALVQAFGWEDHQPLLIALLGLLPIAMLPAYGALGVGVWQRQRALAALAAVLVLGHLLWTVPDLWPRGRDSGAGRSLRIYSHNVLYSNSRMSAAARTIQSKAPDIVVLLELSARNLPPLERTLNSGRYPYQLVRPAVDGAFGFGIWSRAPLADMTETSVAGFPVGEVTVLDGMRPIRLYAIHIVGPVNHGALTPWRAELAWLAGQVRDRGDERMILAGDFNATPQHRDFRRLLAAGVRDAHTAVGGWAPTWPRTWKWLPPVLRIDHVLVSPGIGVRDQRVVGTSGSDHAGLITDLTY